MVESDLLFQIPAHTTQPLLQRPPEFWRAVWSPSLRVPVSLSSATKVVCVLTAHIYASVIRGPGHLLALFLVCVWIRLRLPDDHRQVLHVNMPATSTPCHSPHPRAQHTWGCQDMAACKSGWCSGEQPREGALMRAPQETYRKWRASHWTENPKDLCMATLNAQQPCTMQSHSH